LLLGWFVAALIRLANGFGDRRHDDRVGIVAPIASAAGAS